MSFTAVADSNTAGLVRYKVGFDRAGRVCG